MIAGVELHAVAPAILFVPEATAPCMAGSVPYRREILRMRSLHGFFIKFLLPLPLAAVAVSSLPAAPKETEVNVNVILTEAGRNFASPAPGAPVYYYPLVGGFREEGAIMAGDKPPARNAVLRQLAKTLAEQGYLVMNKNSPSPTVALVFHWGSMNPEIFNAFEGDDENAFELFSNQSQMLALVGAQMSSPFVRGMEREAILEAAREDRYFVVVSAYDIKAALQKRKVLLWRARMSTPSLGVTADQVMGALIKSGGPHFGKETRRPALITAPLEQRERVDLGEMEVKEYTEPALSPSPKPAQIR